MPPATAADVREAHSELAGAGELIRARRVFYRAVAEAVDSPLAMADDRVLDNPLVRGRLGAAFTGAAPPPTTADTDLDELVGPSCSAEVAGHPVRLASTDRAPGLLAPALTRVHAAAHGIGAITDLVVTGDRARLAFDVLVAGIRLALAAVPALATDLLPHVALVVALDRTRAARLGSASERDHPGMVVLPEPVDPAEVAEALVHEGAHQKFFDLAVTHELLADGHWDAPLFRPSWARPDVQGWPHEQAFTAWHAYTCLAALAASGIRPAPGSLLPHARERAAEIDRWLLERGRFIGRDGHRLVAALTGHVLAARPEPTRHPAGDVIAVHRCGGRVLIVRDGTPPRLSWARADLVPATM